MTCVKGVNRLEKRKQMQSFWDLRSSSSCSDLTSYFQSCSQNLAIPDELSSNTQTNNKNECCENGGTFFKRERSSTESLKASLSSEVMAQNGFHHKPYSSSSLYDSDDDATVESQPIKIEPMRELWDAVIGYALEQNKMLKEQERELKEKSARKLKSPWTPSVQAVTPKFEFETSEALVRRVPTCDHLELKNGEQKEQSVKVEQRKQEWDAKLSPMTSSNGFVSPGTPNGGANPIFPLSKVLPLKEEKGGREVVLKEMKLDQDKEAELKRKQKLLFKQTQAPLPPPPPPSPSAGGIRDKQAPQDLTNATNKTTSVFIRLSDESPSSQKAPMNNHTDNQFHSSTVSATVNKPTETSSSSSANENRANSAGNFHQENVNNRGSSSEVNGTSCDQKNGSLACDNNNRNSSNRGCKGGSMFESDCYKTEVETKIGVAVPVSASGKTKKAPPPPCAAATVPERRKLNEAIINTFQHNGSQNEVIIIEKK